MINSTLKTAVNYHHICHPFDLRTDKKKLSCKEKIMGIAIFIFGSMITCGGLAFFELWTAFRKQKKIQEIKIHPNRKEQIQINQTQTEEKETAQILKTNTPLIEAIQTASQSQSILLQDLEAYEKAYNLDEVISKVTILSEEVAKTGRKLGLFIGRTAKESLPSEDEDKNITWISLDKDMGSVPIAGRIHLTMNFNDEVSMKKISNLFDKVVLDLSVLKFFDEDPWRHLGRLLKKDHNATLITEATGYTGLLIGREKAEDKYYMGAISFTLEEHRNKELKDQALLKAYREIEKYLQTIFSDVQLIEGKTYPYKTEYSLENNPHFILKGPKYPEISYSKLHQDAIARKKSKGTT